MDYSLNKRKLSVGPKKGQEVFVASPVCQKQRISFDKLCERMAGGQYGGRRRRGCRVLQVPQGAQRVLLERLHRRWWSARDVPTHVHLESRSERRGFQTHGVHLEDADSLHTHGRFPPAEER